nr:hypothetical protein [Pseudomonadota bacterium]
GHHEAQHYPIWQLWEETRVAKDRINRRLASDAVVSYMACATAFAGGKPAMKKFREFLENFTDGEDI